MASTTAIELAETAAPSSIRNPAPGHDSSPDSVLQASRVADSTVPDGGYGWVIIASGAVMFWWAGGTVYSWGVMQEALVREDVGSPAVLSFVGSLASALVSAMAVFNARLMRALGVKWTAVVGVSLLGGSDVLSGFAVKSLGGLFVTSGVVTGLGLRYVRVVCMPREIMTLTVAASSTW